MAHRPTAAVPSDLKLSNRMQVLEVFKWGGQHTINQAARQIGLSRQTVMKAVQFFVDKGILTIVGKGNSTSSGGKRPDLFALTGQKYLLCIDLWPDQLNFTLLDFQCHTIDRLHLPQPLPDDLQRTVQMVGAAVPGLLSHNQVTKEMLCGVCISTSGIVNYHTNALRYNSNSPGWGTDVPLADSLRPFFSPDTLIVVENIAKLTARSLLKQTELQTLRVLSVFTAWGLSGCFIDRGHIMNGKDSLIGEFGHMILAPDDDERCGCGCYGCFERLVSNSRLRRRAAVLLRQDPDSILNSFVLSELTIHSVFTASRRGDRCARQLADETARLFAMAVRNITLAFDPDVVVFQGDYADADDYFLQRFQSYLQEFQYYPPGGPFRLQLDPRPLESLSLEGAYLLLMDRLFRDSSIYV